MPVKVADEDSRTWNYDVLAIPPSSRCHMTQLGRSLPHGIQVFTLLLLSCRSVGLAQTATQGTETRLSQTEFHSPMVLETAFPSENALRGGGWVYLPEWLELGKFTCDGVALKGENDEGFFWDRPTTKRWDSGLKVKTQALPNNNVEVRFRVSVNNPQHNHDKMVSVRIEIVNGDEIVALEPARIKAKDNGDGHAALLKTVISRVAITPTTKLRITVTTQDY